MHARKTRSAKTVSITRPRVGILARNLCSNTAGSESSRDISALLRCVHLPAYLPTSWARRRLAFQIDPCCSGVPRECGQRHSTVENCCVRLTWTFPSTAGPHLVPLARFALEGPCRDCFDESGISREWKGLSRIEVVQGWYSPLSAVGRKWGK